MLRLSMLFCCAILFIVSLSSCDEGSVYPSDIPNTTTQVTTIYYSTFIGSRDAWQVNQIQSDGTSRQVITLVGESTMLLSAPNKRANIAVYSRAKQATTEIVKAALDGSDAQTVVTIPEKSVQVYLSANGQKILYTFTFYDNQLRPLREVHGHEYRWYQ